MVAAADAPVLAVLTRAPSSGGKTRLFRSLGLRSDPNLLAALLLDTLDGAAVAGVRRVVAVTPETACGEVQRIVDDLTGEVEVVAQSAGDLGARMRETMRACFARGASIVALMGSDVPHITPATVADAFARAAAHPDALVLGPAADGGYYLIAAQRVPEVFSGIEWGSGDVLARTERAAAAHHFRVERLATLADVDTVADLHAAVRSGLAPRTAAWLNGLPLTP